MSEACRTRTASAALGAPAEFQAALADLGRVRIRPEIELGVLPAPARLAPWSHALSVDVVFGGDRSETASGRLILLHDPEGVNTWEGTLRVVVFLTAEIDQDIATDPLLPEVAWSWLTERLEENGVGYRALGGTVTATSSTRFGDIAGPTRTDDLELRASWTPVDAAIGDHLLAYCEVLATAAGLPPEGVVSLRAASPPNVR